MEWLAEALDFIKRETSPVVQEVDGVTFSNSTFTEIKPAPEPLHGFLSVTTLAALRDLIDCNFENISEDGLPLIHINDYLTVTLESGFSDEHGRRQVYAVAKPAPYTGYQFGTYYGLEAFRIAIQAHFAPTADRDYLLAVASKITSGEVVISEDDGISQQVQMNAGLSLKAVDKLRGRVTLAPFRTFPEVDQPQSEFIVRAQSGKDSIASISLTEADGGKWRIAAVQNIAFTLKELGVTLPIIA